MLHLLIMSLWNSTSEHMSTQYCNKTVHYKEINTNDFYVFEIPYLLQILQLANTLYWIYYLNFTHP